MPTPKRRLTWPQTFTIIGGAAMIGAITVGGIGAVTVLGPRHQSAPAVTAIALIGVASILGFAFGTQTHFTRTRKDGTMSAITGTEPAHWHDPDGRHRMKDPRTIPGWNWDNTSGNWSDPDERAYVAHLIAHETLPPEKAMDPVAVRPDDDEATQAVIAAIGATQKVLSTYHEMLAALRLRRDLASRRNSAT
jgi:hypothetical protein